MKTKVTETGVTIPREWFHGIDEVEIRRKDGAILLVPVQPDDPIRLLGKHPVAGDVTDGSVQFDEYVYDQPF